MRIVVLFFAFLAVAIVADLAPHCHFLSCWRSLHAAKSCRRPNLQPEGTSVAINSELKGVHSRENEGETGILLADYSPIYAVNEI